MLDAKPSDPTITTNLGFEISFYMEKLSAVRTEEWKKSECFHLAKQRSVQ